MGFRLRGLCALGLLLELFEHAVHAVRATELDEELRGGLSLGVGVARVRCFCDAGERAHGDRRGEGEVEVGAPAEGAIQIIEDRAETLGPDEAEEFDEREVVVARDLPEGRRRLGVRDEDLFEGVIGDGNHVCLP